MRLDVQRQLASVYVFKHALTQEVAYESLLTPLTRALEIFERFGTLVEPDKVRAELAELPAT